MFKTNLATLRNLVKIVVITYIAGGIAYWATVEVFIRAVGKEITFSPLVSILLVVPFWPMIVYLDLRWIGILPQDVAAILAVLTSVTFAFTKMRRNLF